MMVDSDVLDLPVPAIEDGEYFIHPSRRWMGILVVFSGLAVTGVVLGNPFESGFFVLGFVAAVYYSVVLTILSLRAPRGFRVNGQTLSILWRRQVDEVSLNSVEISRLPRFIYKGALVLVADSSRFIVFDDLSDFKRFVAILHYGTDYIGDKSDTSDTS